MITADMALEQGREVLAVPGNVSTPNAAGPLYLIQQGAKLVMRGRDVLEEIPGLALPEPVVSAAKGPETTRLDSEALRILSGLEIDEGTALDSLVEKTRVDAGVLLGRLLELELAGRRKISIASIATFPVFRSGVISRPAPCPAASSRCWRFRAR